MITLGRLVEEVTGTTLAVFLQREIFGPLGMRDTGFFPDARRCVPTSEDAPGVVHDPLARAYLSRGHQSGNAGLFSTGDDLAIFCRALLRGEIVKRKTLDLMFASNPDTRGLGWDVFNDPPYAPGVGHTGYTGTLLWLRPDQGRFAVVLTNRVYPDDTAKVKRLRREILRVVNPSPAKD